MRGIAVECRQLCKTYVSQIGAVEVLNNLSFAVAEREFVCLVGPSGCGKTTVLKLIAGLLQPTSGQIVYRAGELNGRPRNAMVFQEHGLFPWLTVVENVAFGLAMQGVGKQARQDRARAFLGQVGLTGFAESYPHQLSVGMRQRAAIARAFLVDPHILLMDEPFSALDAQTKLILQEELLRIWGDDKKTVLYITHDIEEAIVLGDRVLVMTGRPGRICEEIPIPLSRPRQLLNRDYPEVKALKWHIWHLFEAEVRQSLGPSR